MNVQELQNNQKSAEFQPLHQPSKSQPLACSQGTPANNVCLNSNCTHRVFLCGQKSCPCFKQHKGCIKSSIQSIVQALDEKLITIFPFESKVNELIKNAIDDLSVFAEQIIDRARETLDYMGLTLSERKFLKVIKKGENHHLTGKEMHDIYESIDGNEQFTIDLYVIEQKINNAWASLTMEMEKSFSNVKKLLNLLTDSAGSLGFVGSKIIVKNEDRNNLNKYFPKNIKETELLYRASQNSFQVNKFYENCQNISNTLVICKTEYGKIIGGFTPLEWKKMENQEQFFEDRSGNSFVFSLTNNDKFRLLPNCYAMKYSVGGGPTFGNTAGLDFSICNNANKVAGSMGNINNAYHNERYAKGNFHSWQMFSGSAGCINFLVKEWEAWHVKFEL